MLPKMAGSGCRSTAKPALTNTPRNNANESIRSHKDHMSGFCNDWRDVVIDALLTNNLDEAREILEEARPTLQNPTPPDPTILYVVLRVGQAAIPVAWRRSEAAANVARDML